MSSKVVELYVVPRLGDLHSSPEANLVSIEWDQEMLSQPAGKVLEEELGEDARFLCVYLEMQGKV